MKKQTLRIVLIATLTLSAVQAQAQLWSGIIAPSRATDWTTAGATIQTGWTQCGSTIAAYTGTAATINNAIAACGNNQYVLLGAGTFNLSTGVDFQGRSSVILRGSGANQTMMVFSGDAACGGLSAAFCVEGDNSLLGGSSGINPDNTATWTATSYAAGQTQITLSILTGSLANLHVGNPIILDQCDSGLSGSTCATGTDTDTGQVWICETVAQGCSDDNTGPSGGQRANRAEEQIVTVTAINGSTITFTPGLRMPNWSASLSPQAFWSSSPNHDVGIEDLSSDFTAAAPHTDITIWNCYNCWVKGVRSIFTTHNVSNNQYSHVWLVLSPHVTIRDSYFFGSQSLQSEGYGIEFYATGDDLAENNIFQQMPSPQMLDGACSGCVVGYNFSINDNNQSNFLFNSFTLHAPIDFTLAEGNIGNSYRSDLFHGSHNFNTAFRNYYNGWETAPINNGFTADYLDPASRYYNMIGNVFGQPSFFTCYQETPSISCAQWPVYTVGTGTTTVQTGGDALTVNSLMRWGNYDTFNSATHFLSSEVPSSFSDTTGNPSLFVNPVPSSQSLPASFYYSSKPSWWPSGKPWPAIGPDVTGGNVAGLGGHVYTIPAQDCYTNVMGGPANGTGSALSFNASTCYTADNPQPASGGTTTACTISGSGDPCTNTAIMACAGGPPNYCARTDTAMQYITFPNLPAHDPYDSGPPVGRVFVMPDFGARVMRVTDEQSGALNTSVNETNDSFFTSANDGFAGFSAYNSALGGYYFSFGSREGYGYIDFFNPSTMTITPYVSPSRNSTSVPGVSWSWNDPNVGWKSTTSAGDVVLDAFCMSTASTSDPWCTSPGPDGNAGSNGLNLIYDFGASCPNFPADLTGLVNGSVIMASHDDSKWAVYAGGVSQDFTKYVFFYDKTNNTCRWLDAVDGIEGGTGISPTHLANSQMPNPTSSPTVTASATGGFLHSDGTTVYCAKYTVLSSVFDQNGTGYPTAPIGETLPSPEGCAPAMPSTTTGSLTITWPSAAGNNPNGVPFASFGNGYTGGNYNIYVSQGSGTETLQSKGVSSGYTQSVALVAGAAPPTSSNAGFNIHYAQVNLAPVPGLGPAVYLQSARSTGSNTSPIWFPENVSMSWCGVYPSSDCAGHNGHGYTHMVNGPNNYGSELASRTYTSPSTGTQITTAPPCNTFINGGQDCTFDSHWAWQADNPSDTIPVFAGFFNSGSRAGNGTLTESPNAGVNPLFRINSTYNREAVTINPVNGTIYRFINNPSTAACNTSDNSSAQNCFYGEGQSLESPDGKWLLMTSAWDFQLGTYVPNVCSNKACAWASGGSVANATEIIDSNGNVETAQNAGAMGTTQPTWPTVAGNTVVDGTVTWKMAIGCPNGNQCRSDVFLVQMR